MRTYIFFHSQRVADALDWPGAEVLWVEHEAGRAHLARVKNTVRGEYADIIVGEAPEEVAQEIQRALQRALAKQRANGKARKKGKRGRRRRPHAKRMKRARVRALAREAVLGSDWAEDALEDAE